MTLQKGLFEPQGLPLEKAPRMGVLYSLVLAPCSQIPTPSWSPSLYLTRAATPERPEVGGGWR